MKSYNPLDWFIFFSRNKVEATRRSHPLDWFVILLSHKVEILEHPMQTIYQKCDKKLGSSFSFPFSSIMEDACTRKGGSR